VCRWWGVTCSKEVAAGGYSGGGDVIGLFLQGNRLEGTLPRSLASLSRLIAIDADGNEGLSGTLPPELQRLSASFASLSLDDTAVSGTLPALLTSSLTLLQKMELENARISTPPESIREYPRSPESTREYPRSPEITREYPRYDYTRPGAHLGHASSPFQTAEAARARPAAHLHLRHLPRNRGRLPLLARGV